MTAKEYLKQLWWIDKEIHEKMMEQEWLKTKAEGTSPPEVTGMPRSAGGKDKISSVIIKMVDLQNYIKMRTDELIDLRITITKQINGLEDQRSRIVLSCRYLRRMKWEQIEKEMAYEKSSIMRMHRKALKEFEKKYPAIRSL